MRINIIKAITILFLLVLVPGELIHGSGDVLDGRCLIGLSHAADPIMDIPMRTSEAQDDGQGREECRIEPVGPEGTHIFNSVPV